MSTSVLLALILLVAVVAAFIVLHSVLRDVPRKRTMPREGYRWPVWNWYPLAVVGILVLALGAALVMERQQAVTGEVGKPFPVEAYEADDSRMEPGERRPVRGTDPLTTGTTGGATETEQRTGPEAVEEGP